MSYTALGGMVTAFSIASGSAQYPMVMAVDRFGARYILIGGLTLLSLSVALMSMAAGYLPFLVLAFLAGLGNSVFHPADYTILGASVSEHRLCRAYSIHTFSGHVGWSVTPLLYGWILDQGAPAGVFLAAGTMMLLSLLAALAAARSRARAPQASPAE